MGDNRGSSIISVVGSTVVKVIISLVDFGISVVNFGICVVNFGFSKFLGPGYQLPAVPYYNEWPEVRTIIKTIIAPGNINTREKEVLIKRCEQENTGLRNVESEIIKQMHLREKTWTEELGDSQTPVLVFCVNSSRIGTDIESALRGVRDNRPVVVVLHCKNSSSLKGNLSDDDYLLDQGLHDRVTGIAHFAFSEFEGFFSCRQNDDGFTKLRNLITY